MEQRKSAAPLPQPMMKRYWPGKAPIYADAKDEDDEPIQTIQPMAPIITDVRDRRLDRLQAVTPSARRVRHEAQVIEEDGARPQPDSPSSKPQPEDEEHQHEAEAARQRRARMLARVKHIDEDEEILKREDEEDEDQGEEEEEEESSSEESDSEGEGVRHVLLKPVFVPKAERETIAERERLQEEQDAEYAREKARLEARKQDTRSMLVQTIAEDEKARAEKELDVSDEELPDTDDDQDAETEYAAWKLRELKRIKRDQDDRERIKRERDEVERWRNMTEEERKLEDMKNPKPSKAPKGKMKYMQKYYHKGVFYQDDEGVAKLASRDYMQPTLEDKFNKEQLPSVLQVKNFGRSGRVKWTHLTNEDTTDWKDQAAPWRQRDPLLQQYVNKMGGMHAPLQRPKGKRKHGN
eukprot:c6066_g1_i1.p1 GENE.c6066_g1_i1~~c6066_g1_i1.p1  ORF type:complete len:420 (+),score=112.67 c6066_g1_i1:34-1260(+)